MGGKELDQHVLGDIRIDAGLHRRAAVHLADRIAKQHPTELDDAAPEYAGQLVAQDITVRTALRDLLDAIGYTRKEHRP
ncbi:hypothetical protein AB0N99_30480 [Streptomyces sp. NPDC093272]|uniref:hypothetical protein n=1 Tax=Streptomyces sp. NPDC093272 TaxID=3154981 RepID=UPI003417A8E8